MILLHVTYRMTPETRDAFVADLVANRIQELTEQENGNMMYRFSIPLDCRDEVMLTECWKDPDVLTAHFSSANIMVLKALKEKYGVESSIEKFEV